jgi:hypothetical protein
MLENQTQYRFRRRRASHFDVPRIVRVANEKRRHEVGVSLLHVAAAAGQVASSSSVQLRFTCSLQLR